MKWEYTILSIKEFRERIESGIISSNWELIAFYKGDAYFKRPKTTSENAEIYKSNIEGYFGGKVG